MIILIIIFTLLIFCLLQIAINLLFFKYFILFKSQLLKIEFNYIVSSYKRSKLIEFFISRTVIFQQFLSKGKHLLNINQKISCTI